MAICVASPSLYVPTSHVPFEEEVLGQDMATIATFTSSSPPFRLTTSQKVLDSDGSSFRTYGPSSPSLLHVNNTSQASPLALTFNKNLNADSPPLSIDDLLPILVNCIDCKNLTEARHAHFLLCNYGLEDHSKIVNYVVPMFVSCGSALDAQQALIRSSDHCNEHSWTTLIQGFIDSGDSWHGLNLYEDMLETSVNPSGHTFVALLKACTKQRWLERGWDLHTEITKLGLGDHPFLGNTLVGLYARCGTPQEARSVFYQLLRRDVVSWNALLAGYSENGWVTETITCINEMESQGVSPDCITYTCGVKVCSSDGNEALQMGQTLHAQIIKKGIETEDLLGGGLVIMYANSGALAEGCKVFDELVFDNGMVCNALMEGFMEKGLYKEVLQFSTQLPDVSAFAGSLKVYGIMEATDKGQELHSALVKRGYDINPFLGSALVDMYVKCASLAKAQEAFDGLTVRNAVSWNTLLAGYTEHGLDKEDLSCFQKMQDESILPDSITLVCSLKACSSTGDINKGRQVYVDVVRKGVETDTITANTMIDMFVKCGSLDEAQNVLSKLCTHNVVSWTALIAGYIDYTHVEEALNCLEVMRQDGIYPTAATFVCSLKACANSGEVKKGQKLHAEIVMFGLEIELLVGITLIDMYASYGLFQEAFEVLEKLPSHDVITWNGLIAAFVEHGCNQEGLDCLEQMQCERVSPNAVTFIFSLKTCCNIGVTEKGRELHVEITKQGLPGADVSIANTLVGMYANFGLLGEAKQVFDSSVVKSVVAWNAIIAAYTEPGHGEAALMCFEEMEPQGASPDLISVVCTIKACGTIDA